MFATTPIAAIRSAGSLSLGFARVDDATRLMAGYQSGCLRARLPRVDPGVRTEVVLINTGGGLTGGDEIEQRLRWNDGAIATVTTQAAEKIYRAIDAPALVRTRIAVAGRADAEWLPQETILFDGAALDRTLEVDVEGDARFLGVEALLFGRTARGEGMARGRLVDRWRIRRDGRLIYADSLRLEGSPEAMLALPAVGDGAAAVATVLLVAPDAAARLAAVRAVIDGTPCRAAASSWNGLLVARFVAPDGEALRQALLPVLACLRDARQLPRVWSC
jgi:urease accessory protein